jgi:CRISPR-associated Csx2 family protein
MEKVESSSVLQEDLDALNGVIDRHLKTAGSRSWIIEYGVNEEELWNNFSILLEMSKHFEAGDEIYLDITHAFRSLPMMSFVMTEFASQVSEIDFKLSSIYYGMFEYSMDPQNPQKGVTPIVDISIIYELHQWIRAIDAMKNYGNLDPLVKLLDTKNNELQSVEKVFMQLNNNLKLANLASLKQFVSTASKKIKILQSTNNRIIKLLSDDIVLFVEKLNKERMSDFQYELAKWFYDNKQYALSYMALAEAIVTKNAEMLGINRETMDYRDKDLQRQIKSIESPYDKDFQKIYDGSILDIRDNIAHQLNKRKDSVNQDIDKLSYFLTKFEDFFKKEPHVRQ